MNRRASKSTNTASSSLGMPMVFPNSKPAGELSLIPGPFNPNPNAALSSQEPKEPSAPTTTTTTSPSKLAKNLDPIAPPRPQQSRPTKTLSNTSSTASTNKFPSKAPFPLKLA